MAQKPKVAVTGGSGKVGREVIKHLVEGGYEVLNVDRRQADDPIAPFCYADLRRREQVQPILERVEAVCHLGEIPHANAGLSPEEIFASNTAAGSVVMQTAADLRLQRVIYTSTCQTYGCWDQGRIPPQYLPFDETHPLRPQNVYALSKVANESYAQFVARKFGLSVAIFRISWVLTPRSIDHMLDWLDRVDGPPDGFGTYVHSTDMARAYRLALEHPRPGCEAYHFAANDVMTRQPIRDRLRQHWPDCPPLPDDWPAFKSPVLTGKAKAHFAWEPQFSLRDEYTRRRGREPQAWV